MGTHVVSGAAHVLVVKTGSGTEFGAVSDRLSQAQPETDFERGVRRFGYLLMEVTLMLVIAIFAINVLLHKPAIDSFLFSLALAVGLTPQLLPAIISINLAHGARRMAGQRVIVKRLDSIEDFGSMDVLCSDKTGTLTQGVVTVSGGFDVRGGDSEDVMLYAYLNSSFETGFTNPIDVAVRASRTFDVSHIVKLDEVPYDFERKRLTILVDRGGKPLMITKGAFANVLAVCTQARMPSGSTVRIDEVRADVEKLYRDLSAKGFRTLGVAVREDTGREIDATAEKEMTLVGVLALFDPPKESATAAVEHLRALGVRLKIITGDNALVACTAGASMGLAKPVVMTGSQLHGMHERALVRRVDSIDIFAEIEPNQKEYLVRLLQKAGHVIGYMGDGINDASALRAADVGISVNSAVDVAKEAADIVLLEPGLDVLAQGVKDGRATFANTLKYVFMATSANFGNMFSMAGASLFLPFLPLLPTQILLTNLLTDFPEMTIASDNVDPELVEQPRRWDIRFIRRFMIVFGLLSSVFDYATFAALLWVMKLPVWGPPGAATTYGALGLDGRAHHPDQAPGVAQQAGQAPDDRHRDDLGGHARHPVHAAGHAVQIRATDVAVPAHARGDPGPLHERGGTGEASLLSDRGRAGPAPRRRQASAAPERLGDLPRDLGPGRDVPPRLAQLAAPVLPRRVVPLHQRPERRRVVQPLRVGELVDHHVADQVLRQEHQRLVEADRVLRRAAPPPAALPADHDPRGGPPRLGLGAPEHQRQPFARDPSDRPADRGAARSRVADIPGERERSVAQRAAHPRRTTPPELDSPPHADPGHVDRLGDGRVAETGQVGPALGGALQRAFDPCRVLAHDPGDPPCREPLGHDHDESLGRRHDEPDAPRARGDAHHVVGRAVVRS
jgi:phosphoserine phosphatase